MPSEPKPLASQEFFLHPDAKRLKRMAPEDFHPLMLEQLDQQNQRPVPALEPVMGLGQLARFHGIDGAEADVESFLNRHQTSNGYDIVGLFLMGYWPNRAHVSRRLVDALVAGLSSYENSIDVINTLVAALGISFANVANPDIRSRIRAAFIPLVPKRDAMQAASQRALDRVVTPDSVGMTAHPSDVGEYRAYDVVEGQARFYAIERLGGAEAVRVFALTVEGRVLAVDYEILDRSLTDPDACRLIFHAVLQNLHGNSFHAQVDRIVYKKIGAESGERLTRYGPP